MVEESSNLTINCKQPHNGTIYQVILEKMRVDLWIIIGICKKVEGGLVKEDYGDSGRVDCADSLDLSLQLIHVASGDDGFYRCVFNTDTGVQTTVVQLTITPPGTHSDVQDVKLSHPESIIHSPCLKLFVCTSALQQVW